MALVLANVFVAVSPHSIQMLSAIKSAKLESQRFIQPSQIHQPEGDLEYSALVAWPQDSLTKCDIHQRQQF